MIRSGDEFVYVAPESSRRGQVAKQLEHTIRVRCRQCLNCRIRRAQEWKIRGIHEMQSTFHPTWAVTLTYDDDHLPESGSLERKDLQDFNKRLRKLCGPFRFLACGEYGPTTGRAHYHQVCFGLRLPDAYKGKDHWGSTSLLETWGQGHVSFHLATDQSIGYVSGYVVKKLRTHWKELPIMETVHPLTGEVLSEETVAGEFLQASSGGQSGLRGLGFPWIDQYGPEVIRDGYIVINEKKSYIIPEYYLKHMRDMPGYEEFTRKRFARFADVEEATLDQLATLNKNAETEASKILRDGV